MRLRRDDHAVGGGRGAVGHTQPPTAPLARDARHVLLEPDGVGGQPGGEGANELLHPVGEGHEERPARAAGPGRLRGRPPGSPPEAEDHAPLLALELEKARHGRGQREHVGIGGVDPGHQRLGHALERLAAEPPGHESAEALVGIAAAGQHEIHGHPELARPREEARPNERAESRRREELEAIGQWMQAPAEGDIGAPKAVVGADQPVLDAEPAAERQRPRLLREKRVGAALDEEALVPLRLYGAAHPVAGLQEHQLQRKAALAGDLDGAMGGGKPRDAATDHRELHCGPRSTRSASIAMNAGWSLAVCAR